MRALGNAVLIAHTGQVGEPDRVLAHAKLAAQGAGGQGQAQLVADDLGVLRGAGGPG